MDLLSALTDSELSVVFVVAGWVAYLQNEKGAQAEGGAVAEDEDDVVGVRRNKVTPIDGDDALMWTTGRLRCRNGTGT